ncbi:GNAT family N-acetyltransferase [Mesorhizobium sp. CAU 1732]|uniref:GNAT family N-acetyltransferase n=1 Tax=Mesorhizobium sp. CAU 1732 TaxID=3140358 RepID=UPI003261C95B
MVRHATESDRLRVVRLLGESHKAAGFTFPFDAVRAEALFKQHMAAGLVLVLGDPAQGVLMAAATDHPFGMGRVAKETVWFIRPEARGRSAFKMLDAYEAWAREQGCVAVGMASLATNDVSRLYERRGYAAAETHFLKSL